jgi:hypothetical protein
MSADDVAKGSVDTGEPERRRFPEFYIQIDREISGEATPQFSTQKFVKATTERLQQIGEVMRAASLWVAQEVSAMEHRPSSFSLDFGVDVGGEAGVPFVTKGTIEANFKVTVGWEKNK